MPTELPYPLPSLADTFAEVLRGSEMSRRIAHHAAHVAAETWLAMELAMLVNSQIIPDLVGWRALLERGKIDVTLLPPEPSQSPLFLELKIVDRGYWHENWSSVYQDLVGKPNKSPASVAVCFVFRPTCKGPSVQQATTLKKWNEGFASLPTNLGEVFAPVPGKPAFQLLHSSGPISLSWEHPVPDRWLEGYSAQLSVLWLVRAVLNNQHW